MLVQRVGFRNQPAKRPVKCLGKAEDQVFGSIAARAPDSQRGQAAVAQGFAEVIELVRLRQHGFWRDGDFSAITAEFGHVRAASGEVVEQARSEAELLAVACRRIAKGNQKFAAAEPSVRSECVALSEALLHGCRGE